MNNQKLGYEDWESMIFGYVADPDSVHSQKDFANPGLLIKNTAEAYGLKAPRRGSLLRGRIDELIMTMTPQRVVGDSIMRLTSEIG